MELAGILDSLNHGEIQPIGKVAWGSNFTFLVKLETSDENELWAIYKPIKGERPLWDFPPNLAKRERAAYLISQQLNWGLVPPTILRDGPMGVGSLQFFIEAEKDFFHLNPMDKTLHHKDLEKLCALDVVMNSTDRKSGHILIDKSQKVWAIDNALCFHTDFKLRTVLWDFGGQKIPETIIKDLENFLAAGTKGVEAELKEHLTQEEMEATFTRTKWLIQNGCFPEDPGNYSYPFPH